MGATVVEPDFSGWATKAGIKCKDGRTIQPDAFKDMDGTIVPLVWQHNHNSPKNILGHFVLKAREGSLYGYGYFNDTEEGIASKKLVKHGDIKALSIYANQLIERAKQVYHGVVLEVSLALAGSNKGAFIDHVRIAHSDDPNDIEVLEDEAIISMNMSLEFESPDDAELEHGAPPNDSQLTIQDVFDAMSPEEKYVLALLVTKAFEAGKAGMAHADAGSHSAPEEADEADEVDEAEETDDGEKTEDAVEDTDQEGDLAQKEGNAEVKHNVFDKTDKTPPEGEEHVLSHADVKGIMAAADEMGSLKRAVEQYALAHGIENIDVLFPDAKNVSASPEFIARRMDWVPKVLNGTKHTPFARIKTVSADLTEDDARAKGYVKGELKKDEFFGLTHRTTTPTTVYKKQSLDRDDVIDITEMDVIVWMKGEMRFMLEEEIARAILIGDGRDVSDIDHIKDPIGAVDGVGIRSILNDHELYVETVRVNLGATPNYNLIVEEVLLQRQFYKGTGTPTFYTTYPMMARMLLAKDTTDRRLYPTKADLATALMVDDVVWVEVLETIPNLVGIMVNLQDYNVGTDKGGEINFFDDFDLDFNKLKYLYETRLSGALTKIKSAMVVMLVAATDVLVIPTDPTFVEATGVVTIVATTGVVYKNGVTLATLTAGAQSALAPGATLTVHAVPASGYYFETGEDDDWSFTRPAA